MEGLAIAIGVASLLMVAVPTGLLGGLGYLVLRPRAPMLGAVLGALLGASGGVLVTLATFFESTWSPPPTLRFEVPAGFRHEWVVLIVDPAATAEVAWTGVDAPFLSRHGRLAVPLSGVVRVRDLGAIDGGDVNASLSTGPTSWGRAALNAPPAVGPSRLVAFNFVPYPGTEPDLGALSPAELTALLHAREAER